MNEDRCPVCNKKIESLHDLVVHYLITHIEKGGEVERLLEMAIFSLINSGGEKRKEALFKDMMVVVSKIILEIAECEKIR